MEERSMREEQLRELVETRALRPEAIAEAAAARRRPAGPLEDGRAMVIAADHTGARHDRRRRAPGAMADRARPARPHRAGAVAARRDGRARHARHHRGPAAARRARRQGRVRLDEPRRARRRGLGDRRPLHRLRRGAIEAMGFEGGKMLVRIDHEDPATAATVEACSRAVSDLAARRLVAMVEPFMSRRVDGRVRNDLTTEAAIRASVIAAGLGTTSAYTWLKVPVVEDMERVAAATTLPTRAARRRGRRRPGRDVRALGPGARGAQRAGPRRRAIAAVPAGRRRRRRRRRRGRAVPLGTAA